MATTTSESPSFVENLRAPGWMFGFLGLALGAVSGGLTAVGVRTLTGDPLLSGAEALIFYVTFAIGVVGIVYVMLNSTLMETKVNADGITVRLGVLGTQRTLTWDTINAVRPTHHNVVRHGGRGNPFAPSSRTSWTMYGVRSGVEVEFEDQILFISSRNTEELISVASDMVDLG
ncbi:MAG: hypothetical protein F4X40_06660 [Chloroflexi bacterium]|nr:hypothetical protein [Chloroflexota bacterium]